MRWLVVSIGMGMIGLLFWFNGQPITLYFLGNSPQTALFSLSWPLAVWILLFMLAGVITGLIIQIFHQFSAPSPSRRPRQRFEPPSPRRSAFKTQKPDWEQEIPNEWDIEEPPETSTQPRYSSPSPPQPEIQDRFKAEKPPEPSLSSEFEENSPIAPPMTDFEVPKSPKQTSREGSVYTYTYHSEKRDRPVKPSSDQVYDAPYRVITPPDEKNDNFDEQSEEEEWI